MDRTPRRGAAGLALAAMCLLAAAGGAAAQAVGGDPWAEEQEFLSREYYPLWDERYENYSLLSYRDYGARADRPTYDPFGIYLLDGVDILRLNELRTREARTGSSDILWNLQRFRNLVIIRDNYGGWGSRFMMGNLLDGHFTPLTLNLARLEGFRWDASSYRNRFSLVMSRLPTLLGYTTNAAGAGGSDSDPFTSYVTGGHWESRVGDILTFGATYVNFALQDAQQRSNSLRGQVPQRLDGVRDYYLIVSDDSPGDGQGARVHAVRVQSGAQVLDLVPDVRRIENLVAVDHVPHIRRDGAWVPQIPDRDRLLRASGYYEVQGVPVDVNAGSVSVTDTDMLIFRYQVPGDLEGLTFDVQVDGDYSLDVAASYPFIGGGATRWTDIHNVARADGNVQDGANLDWVSVDYGMPTGIELYGGNVSVDLWGVEVEAEYVENVQHTQFPFDGQRQRRTAGALFAKGVWAEGRWRLGGEVVDIPAALETSLPVWSGNSSQTVLRWDLVDDNDDRDEWPDVVEHWDPLHPEYVLGQRTGQDMDSRPPLSSSAYSLVGGYGVFPGLDVDDDGTVDVNINRNQFPDYAEPFFMYAADPDEFVYGDDFNSNGVVDARENDNRPDYPYPRDQRGYHAFAGVRLRPDLGLRLGHYRMAQSAAAGVNRVAYGEARWTAARQGLGDVQLNYRLQRVQDDIADPLYVHAFDQSTTAAVVYRLRPDPLLLTDSVVNTAFVQAAYTGTPALHLSQSVKLERNAMGATDRRDGGDVDDVTYIAKADYLRQFGALSLQPMVKLAWHRRAAPDVVVGDLRTFEVFPIVRADYALSPRTWLRFGMQGLPGFQHRYRDRLGSAADFDARHYVVALQNSSNYTGYDVSVNLSMRNSRSRLINLPGEPLRRFTEFAIQVRVL